MSISSTIKSNEVLKVITRVDLVPEKKITKVVCIGDSVTEGYYDGSPWPNRYSWLNGGYVISANYADGGKTSTQILAEQVPLALASGASHCFTQFGTNDISQSVPMTTTRANAVSIWSALRAGGIEPIHVGLQPVDNTGNYSKACAFNLWAKLYCRLNNILYVDIMPLLSAGGSGTYKTGLGYDTVHPSSVGMKVIASQASEQTLQSYALTPLLAEADDRFFSATPNTIALNGNAISFTGGTPPTGYTQVGSGGVLSVEPPDADGFGSWLRATLTADTGFGFNCTAQSLSSLGWAVGDTIGIGYRVRWVDSAQALTLSANTTGGSTQLFAMFNEQGGTSTGDDMYVYTEGAIPAGTTNISFQWTGTGTGYFEVNRPIIINLTQLGLA